MSTRVLLWLSEEVKRRAQPARELCEALSDVWAVIPVRDRELRVQISGIVAVIASTIGDHSIPRYARTLQSPVVV